ncbi:MAG: tetratricopeptide repeat protein [Bacteroidales bacterium]|nr:tetratricopeptide repeat protein [Bacteroidales bacterium]
MKRFIGAVILISFSVVLKSQSTIDTLLLAMHQEKDSVQLVIYNISIGRQYEFSNIDSSKYYYQKAVTISNIIDNDSLRVMSILSLGYAFETTGRLDSAELLYNYALKLSTTRGTQDKISSVYNSLGNLNYYRGNLKEALEYYQESLKTLKDDAELEKSYAYHNIALVHDDLEQFELAIKYYKQAEKAFVKYDDKAWLSTCYNSLGAVYLHVDSTEIAEEYYMKALATYEILGDQIGMSIVYENLSHCYLRKKQYTSAYEYLKKSLEIAVEIDDYFSLASINNGIAIVLYHLEQYDKSIIHANKSLVYTRKSDFKNYLLANYEILKDDYRKKKEYAKALLYADSATSVSKDIFNSDKAKAIQEMESRYQSQEQKSKIQNLEKEKAIKIRQNRLQKMALIGATIGLLLIIVFAMFLYRTLTAKKKANRLLEEQKEEIEEQNNALNQLIEETLAQKEEIESQQDKLLYQNEELEKIHVHISQSIEYAKRIQHSILPSYSILQSNLNDHFVFYKPKDVVSGDFYWWAKLESNIVVTVADCTGHGVPGAFMSMLGISFLREIILKEYITHPGVILRKLRKEVITALQQKIPIELAKWPSLMSVKDGMDMSLININKNTKVLQYAGANNPIYIIRNDEFLLNEEQKERIHLMNFTDSKIETTKHFYELKPDKMPIAIYDNMGRFTTHELQLNDGDLIYMFSDGFADQFGGPDDKKFKYKSFKELLLKNAHLPMDEQKTLLKKAFEDWKQDKEQVDDVLVLGIRI